MLPLSARLRPRYLVITAAYHLPTYHLVISSYPHHPQPSIKPHKSPQAGPHTPPSRARHPRNRLPPTPRDIPLWRPRRIPCPETDEPERVLSGRSLVSGGELAEASPPEEEKVVHRPTVHGVTMGCLSRLVMLAVLSASLGGGLRYPVGHNNSETCGLAAPIVFDRLLVRRNTTAGWSSPTA
jgi:hypothetical protein